MADLFGNIDRTERQAIGVQKWINNKLCGSFVYCTGFILFNMLKCKIYSFRFGTIKIYDYLCVK